MAWYSFNIPPDTFYVILEMIFLANHTNGTETAFKANPTAIKL